MEPKRPEHANTIHRISGTDPRFRIKRMLMSYAYPVNGNVHNPTPSYLWLLLLDDRVVDQGPKRRDLVAAARVPDAVALYSE